MAGGLRVAVVSDIHGNLTALEAVAADLRRRAPDLVVHGGDLALMGPPDKAGLAAGLQSTSQQLGMALGLAVLSAIATARTHHLLAAHAARPDALTSGYQRALVVCSIFVLAAAVIASRTPNLRAAAQPLVVPGEPAPEAAVL